jgi:hypothetical protein
LIKTDQNLILQLLTFIGNDPNILPAVDLYKSHRVFASGRVSIYIKQKAQVDIHEADSSDAAFSATYIVLSMCTAHSMDIASKNVRKCVQ